LCKRAANILHRKVGKVEPGRRKLFRDSIILTAVAGKVTAERTEAEDLAAREKMVQRFFFDWIDTVTADDHIIKRDERTFVVFAHGTDTGFTVSDGTVVGAEQAADTGIIKSLPE